MKKKEIWAWVVTFTLILFVAGIFYVNKRQELKTIQRDLANHLYGHYRLYTYNDEQYNKISEEFNGGEGTMTIEEFFEQTTAIREYEDIEKIEIIGFSKHPMGGFDFSFTINGVYSDYTTLNTIRHETGEFDYSIGTGNDRNEYYLEELDTPTLEKISEEKIIYYKGNIESF